MKSGLANYLTYFRIACVPFFLLFFIQKNYSLALLFFSTAAFTDLIDGTIARLLHQHSQWGALLDPIADKLLMVSTFISLAVKGSVPPWFVFMLVARDIMIMGGVALLRYLKIEVALEPLWSSKLTTLMLIITGIFGLIKTAYPDATLGAYPMDDMLFGSIAITVALVLLSALQYFRKGMEVLIVHKSI